MHFAGQAPIDELPADPAPTIALESSTVRAGGRLTVAGDGFLPGEQVQIWIHSDPVLAGVVTADASGGVRHAITVPADLPPGVHHVELRGVTSGRSVRSAELTVLAAATAPGSAGFADGGAAPAGLAFTGAGGRLLAPGLALLLAGAALVLITRRTNRQGAR